MKKINKKIILITGIAGMIGSILLEQLIKKNYIIIGIDNFRLGKLSNINKFLKNKNFYFFKINLSKKVINNKIIKLLDKKKIDYVWHLAANSDIKSGINNPDIDFKNTFLTTYNVLKFISLYSSYKTKFIFSSSSAVFGEVKKNISENTQTSYPCSNYGSMKLSSESVISSFSYLYNFKSFIFRFPNVVGKNLTHGVIFDMEKKIKNKKNKFLKVLGNGNQCKPYSHVSEIIKCMLFIISKKHKKFTNYYNIGTNDKGVRVKEIVKILVNKFKYKKKIIYQKQKSGWKGDIIKYQYSTKKIEKLGFRFKLSSEQAVKRAIKEYQ